MIFHIRPRVFVQVVPKSILRDVLDESLGNVEGHAEIRRLMRNRRRRGMDDVLDLLRHRGEVLRVRVD